MLALFGWFTSALAQPSNSFPLWPEGAPGALGKDESTRDESFSEGLLEDLRLRGEADREPEAVANPA